ncbi:protein Skeletor, isoforms B/C-like [Antedon mediterranea]|uniref:protein Skeletor, isoforms B/C-like n=1 Tax=Antedon mediterranea TaxID=105859 RepID=UPI003AF8AA41
MACTNLFILEFIVLLISGVKGQEAVDYFGKEIGDFGQQSTPSYDIQGTVYAINDNKLWLRGFTYNGNAPDAYFWAGTSTSPDDTGSLIPDEIGRTATLRAYDNENFIISLPPGGDISELKWIAVWSQSQSMSFAHVNIATSFVPPSTHNLGHLGFDRLVHDTEADSVEIIDTQTVKFYNLKYDGRGPAAYFWVGTGSVSASGSRIPDETGRIKVLRKYTGEDITVQFDGDRTVFSYGYIGLWCEAARQNFGHVEIPNRNQLNVPPSLENFELVNEYDNCEELDERLQVSWTVRDDDVIDIQLRGRVNVNDYMAFGLSGSTSSTLMFGADVTVAWFDGNIGRAQDYKLTAYAQCSGGSGACPDTEVGAVNDVDDASAVLLNGVTSIAFSRKLDTGDSVGDKVISTTGSTQIVWSIGQINADRLAVRHIERGGMSLSFGRSPSKSCSSLGDLDEVNGWKELRLIGDEDNMELTAVIGQSGGERGYTSITDNVGWGISWYINDMLIPRIYLKRNVNYTFKVLGGNDASQSASYHPFYITNDKGGGYASLTDMEKVNHVIYAGPVNGTLCELNDKNGDKSTTSTSAEAYRKTLEMQCASPKEEATLTWTPDASTPDIVYYQCYTHRFLGWQINVVDELPPSSSTTLSPVAGLFYILSFSIIIGLF